MLSAILSYCSSYIMKLMVLFLTFSMQKRTGREGAVCLVAHICGVFSDSLIFYGCKPINEFSNMIGKHSKKCSF